MALVMALGATDSDATGLGADRVAVVAPAGRPGRQGVWILALGVTFAIQGLGATEGAGTFAVKEVFLSALGTRTAEVMLFITVGAQLYCGMSSITSASRMMYAFSRDGATPGHRLWPLHRSPIVQQVSHGDREQGCNQYHADE